jgi:hypothetical protein
MAAFERIARFLDDNPGEVLIIDVEDYVTPKDMVGLIKRSGLGDHVYRGPFKPPWPKLRHMVELDQRVLIMAEHRAGAAPWYRRTYSMFQETPFSFKRPGQMSCAPNRGSSDNSLFLVNHWIDTDPAPKPTNAKKVNARAFLLDRVRRCQRRRGLTANAVSVDFYRQGDLLGVVDALNGVGGGS